MPGGKPRSNPNDPRWEVVAQAEAHGIQLTTYLKYNAPKERVLEHIKAELRRQGRRFRWKNNPTPAEIQTPIQPQRKKAKAKTPRKNSKAAPQRKPYTPPKPVKVVMGTPKPLSTLAQHMEKIPKGVSPLDHLRAFQAECPHTTWIENWKTIECKVCGILKEAYERRNGSA